ncbi:Gnt-I system high-affinity gluconate transporter [Parabacteroides sp. PH5-13]|uniref:gluconate:H+ symporter n=1 Tax=unclassified Parabacteroides TaxID=2649774 RepID=UPI00247305C6|nr:MULTISPECIES: gluconate:H+ symporter [unclassified Parabacteroides]MDH6305324.1 Gnt-I system high-affinity gluconate transporter [Parabacteroides sp. PH5-39]MDH6320143.1 Gnt-I system high-affinity gluconate transporter [Parabacteroides sp. PH5-13]MDH6323914.1 Gnt-I system high-affinity gluconate transporter [Parabacteroides sp. PH5-8]MDH6385026.1 Gnt-I system high-affinity gluconate transporter [Parabacteroides sp. PH5-17]MDH6394340.1 Gnt-I system high-affinity gluconate transporter [Paraba
MTFIIVIVSLAILILLISYFKVDAFLSFLLVSVGAGIALGIPLERLPGLVDEGIGNILGSLTLIIVLGAMLGKLVAESGAAKKIASVMVDLFGTKYIQWGLMITGFIVGIPLFYGIGFVLLVPLIFSVVNQYKLPAVYIGLPMLAALSVTHGFLPPHPSPVALVSLFDANLGMTLILGLCIAIPAIIIAGPLFAKTLKNVRSGPVTLFEQKEENTVYGSPGKANSLISATLPVFLLIIVTIIPLVFTNLGKSASAMLSLVGAPSIVMLISLIVATYTLGLKQGRSMKDIMAVYVDAVKDIAMILLIIAGSGIFKQVMEESGVSTQLAEVFKQLPIHPLILGWLITAIIRVCIGSATVAALTAAGVIMPLVAQTGVNPNLMVLSLGAGSLFFSHVNDSGFWLFKEYFNLSLKDTFRSWSVMETIVSVVGLIGVLLLSVFI